MRVVILLLFMLMSGLKEIPAQTSHSPIRDGVYLSFEEVRKNSPSIVRSQLFRSYYDTVFSILQWSRTPSLYYFDSLNRKTSLRREAIVLIAEDGTVYIQQNGLFHRAVLFGPITVFTEVYPREPHPMALAVTELKASTRDRLLDVEGEKVYDYSLNDFMQILKRDAALYREFSAIRGTKQKRKLMYRYIEKYNERNSFW
jgi:hypothetical protein